MRTFVIPTDFSDTANNAAEFAFEMLKGQHDVNIILYHVYEKESQADYANTQLQALRDHLNNKQVLRVEILAVQGDDLIDEIERVVRHRQASLVIMGLTGKHAFAQMFMGSNTLKLVDRDLVPVLIIPPDAKYTGIKNVALTSDFKKVKLTTPSAPIKSVLQMFRPAFHIINVDDLHYVSLTDEYRKERDDMMEMFSEFNPEFYFIGMYDFHEAIEQFSKDKQIDMLITVPRKHSFLESLFKRSHTKSLVYHSTVPILATPE